MHYLWMESCNTNQSSHSQASKSVLPGPLVIRGIIYIYINTDKYCRDSKALRLYVLQDHKSPPPCSAACNPVPCLEAAISIDGSFSGSFLEVVPCCRTNPNYGPLGSIYSSSSSSRSSSYLIAFCVIALHPKGQNNGVRYVLFLNKNW